jgi:DNA polymerase-1
VPVNFARIDTLDQVKRLADVLTESGKTIGFDIETGYTGMPQEKASLNVYNPNQFIVGFSITNDVRWARYVPLRHDFGDNLDPNEVWPIMKPVLESLPGVAHNLHFEHRNLLALDRKGDGPSIVLKPGPWRDSMIQSYVLSTAPEHGLKFLTKHYYGYDQADISSLFGDKMTEKEKRQMRFNILPISPEVIDYACDDSIWSLRIDNDLYEKVIEERSQIYHLEMQILQVLIDMTEDGVTVDWEFLDQNLIDYEKFVVKVEDKTRKMFEEAAGRDLTTLNFRSSQQMQRLLFEDLGLKATRKTGTGKPSTEEKALEALRRQHPAVDMLLKFRQTKKMGEFFETWRKLRGTCEDGKVHPSLNQVRVQGGRFASSDPNIQNIRKHWFFSTVSKSEVDAETDEELEEIVTQGDYDESTYWGGYARDTIVASPGFTLLSFDYSQQELRVLAGLAQEPYLIKAFEEGKDIHRVTASLMFNTPIEKVTPEQRQKAKTINFGLIYQQGSKSLGEQLGISHEEAERLMELYFSSFTSVKDWFNKVKGVGRRQGYVVSFMGRISTVWELRSQNRAVVAKADRKFVNLPVQGGGADITKVAMVNARRKLIEVGWWMTKVRLLMNQHDSLVFEVSNDLDLVEVKNLLQPEVSFPINGFPKFEVDWEYGTRWGSLTKLEDGGIIELEEPPAPAKVEIRFESMPSVDVARSVMDSLKKYPGPCAVELIVGDESQLLPLSVAPSSDMRAEIILADYGNVEVL